jgi:hypothetical protein
VIFLVKIFLRLFIFLKKSGYSQDKQKILQAGYYTGIPIINSISLLIRTLNIRNYFA